MGRSTSGPSPEEMALRMVAEEERRAPRREQEQIPEAYFVLRDKLKDITRESKNLENSMKRHNISPENAERVCAEQERKINRLEEELHADQQISDFQKEELEQILEREKNRITKMLRSAGVEEGAQKQEIRVFPKEYSDHLKQIAAIDTKTRKLEGILKEDAFPMSDEDYYVALEAQDEVRDALVRLGGDREILGDDLYHKLFAEAKVLHDFLEIVVERNDETLKGEKIITDLVNGDYWYKKLSQEERRERIEEFLEAGITREQLEEFVKKPMRKKFFEQLGTVKIEEPTQITDVIENPVEISEEVSTEGLPVEGSSAERELVVEETTDEEKVDMFLSRAGDLRGRLLWVRNALDEGDNVSFAELKTVVEQAAVQGKEIFDDFKDNHRHISSDLKDRVDQFERNLRNGVRVLRDRIAEREVEASQREKTPETLDEIHNELLKWKYWRKNVPEADREKFLNDFVFGQISEDDMRESYLSKGRAEEFFRLVKRARELSDAMLQQNLAPTEEQSQPKLTVQKERMRKLKKPQTKEVVDDLPPKPPKRETSPELVPLDEDVEREESPEVVEIAKNIQGEEKHVAILAREAEENPEAPWLPGHVRHTKEKILHIEEEIRNVKGAEAKNLESKLGELWKKFLPLQEKFAASLITPVIESKEPAQKEVENREIPGEELAPVKETPRTARRRRSLLEKVTPTPAPERGGATVVEAEWEEPTKVDVEGFEELGIQPWKPNVEEKAAAMGEMKESPVVQKHELLPFVTSKPSLRDRVNRGLGYILNRGKSVYENVPSPRERLSSAYGRGATAAGGFLSAVMERAKVMMPRDIEKYLPTGLFTASERQALKESIYLAMPTYETPSAASEKRLKEHHENLMKRIQESKYIPENKKAAFVSQMSDIMKRYETGKGTADEEFGKEVAKLLSDAVRVKGHLKEKAFELTGFRFLQGSEGRVENLTERWQGLTRDREGTRARENVRRSVIGGFLERRRERVSASRALQVLAVGVGITVPREITKENFHDQVNTLLESYESKVEESAPTEEGVTDSGQVEVVPEEISVLEVPNFEATKVKKAEGITYPLVRIIEENPKRFGYDGPEDDALVHLFAQKEARKMAKRDGLLHAWLKESAVNKLSIVPVERADGWHVGFMDPVTNKFLTEEEMLSYTMKEPRR